MATSKVEQKRYELINQVYTPYVHDCPPANTMQRIIEKDRSIFWSVEDKKYVILEHTMVIGWLTVRLKQIKKLNMLL